MSALIENMTREGYDHVMDKGGVICGLLDFLYTCGIVVDMNSTGYGRRYCFPTRSDAEKAYAEWDGAGHPSGPWIKMKGRYEGQNIDILNPEFNDY